MFVQCIWTQRWRKQSCELCILFSSRSQAGSLQKEPGSGLVYVQKKQYGHQGSGLRREEKYIDSTNTVFLLYTGLITVPSELNINSKAS